MHDGNTYISIRRVDNLNHERFTIKLSSKETADQTFGTFSMSMYETEEHKKVLLLKFSGNDKGREN